MRKRKGCLVKRRKIYYAVWYVDGKRFSKTTGKTVRREAEAELNRIMEPFLARDEVGILQNLSARIDGRRAELENNEDKETGPPLQIDQGWNAYVNSPRRPDSGDTTLDHYKAYYGAFAGWMGEMKSDITALCEVTPEVAEEYATHLNSRAISGNTYNKHIGFLKLCFKVLKQAAGITTNPFEDIQRKRQNQNSHRELTVEELQTVCSTLEGEMKLLFALGIYTGLREKDCALLRWAEVDIKRAMIIHVPFKTASRNPKPSRIPIHPALASMLWDIPKKSRGTYILPETADLYQKDRQALTKKIRNHFIQCGIETIKPGTGKGTGKRAVVEVGFHSLRHSFVSLCREADAPLSVVEAIVGHSSPAMTRHYSHVSDESSQKSVHALPAVFGDSQPIALPAEKLIEASKVHDLANKLTSRNWKKIKGELLAL